ncbi:MAG: histidine phosphatase family protein [Myxococcota bacterium]
MNSGLALVVLLSLLTFHASLAAQTVYFIRHAESEGNVLLKKGLKDQHAALSDPSLTPYGKRQALTTRYYLELREIEAVVVSPMSRTLETAALVFGHSDVPFYVAPTVVEFCRSERKGILPCTIRPKNELKEKFTKFDFDSLDTNRAWGYHSESEAEFEKRVNDFKAWLRQWMRDRKFGTIAVVTHSGFLKTIFNTSSWFKNCQVFVASFDSDGRLIGIFD